VKARLATASFTRVPIGHIME